MRRGKSAGPSALGWKLPPLLLSNIQPPLVAASCATAALPDLGPCAETRFRGLLVWGFLDAVSCSVGR